LLASASPAAEEVLASLLGEDSNAEPGTADATMNVKPRLRDDEREGRFTAPVWRRCAVLLQLAQGPLERLRCDDASSHDFPFSSLIPSQSRRRVDFLGDKQTSPPSSIFLI
jgi:hypothetical protein